MEKNVCPLCGQKKLDFLNNCSCGFSFVKETHIQNEKEKFDLNFYKKYQIAIIVFFSLLGLDFIWQVQKSSDIFSSFLSILMDSIIALPFAALIQFIYNMIKRKNKI